MNCGLGQTLGVAMKLERLSCGALLAIVSLAVALARRPDPTGTSFQLANAYLSSTL